MQIGNKFSPSSSCNGGKGLVALFNPLIRHTHWRVHLMHIMKWYMCHEGIFLGLKMWRISIIATATRTGDLPTLLMRKQKYFLNFRVESSCSHLYCSLFCHCQHSPSSRYCVAVLWVTIMDWIWLFCLAFVFATVVMETRECPIALVRSGG